MQFQSDLSGMRVMVAMPVHHDVSMPTMVSLWASQALALKKYGLHLDLQVQHSNSIIEVARNKCAHAFLQSESTHFFGIDSDMAWEPDSFIRLIALGNKMPVVGAAYAIKQDPPTLMIGHEAAPEQNEYGCIPVTGMGMGFIIVARRVFEKLTSFAPKMRLLDTVEPVARIFRNEINEHGQMSGEDITFFASCKELGFQPYLDPGINLGHVGQKIYRTTFAEYLQAKTGA